MSCVVKPEIRKPRVLLGVPGPTCKTRSIFAIMNATKGMCEVIPLESSGSTDNFELLLTHAHNEFEAGNADLFGMVHTDIVPEPGYVDILYQVMVQHQVSLVSAVMPFKDSRGLLQCGVSIPDQQWTLFRRPTVREVAELPEDWDAEDWGYPGMVTLHNNGCFLVNLHDERLRTVDETGGLVCHFEYRNRISRQPNGKWGLDTCSEDFWFSKQAHALGIRSKLTRRVTAVHIGEWEYINNKPWGKWKVDEEARYLWDPDFKKDVVSS